MSHFPAPSGPVPATQRSFIHSSGDYESLDLASIVVGCQQRHRTAQRELYERSHRQLFRLVTRMIGAQDADDVCQQVFLKAYQSIQQFAVRSNFMTWLYRIAINECLQCRRKRASRPMVNLADFEPIDRAKSFTERTQQKELLEIALGELDPELRSIFLLREVEGLSYAEIGQVMQLPDGTVASRLSRAREQLLETLNRLSI
jgi:RNA polymerase sigma-70 factor (ECF subfamily)